ncbi:MAG TPA: tetratricopeptide repeat protein [Usitatibacter sp.]|nr:tetratricopeptide repeat protein [Usitatibacter sp.]
MSTRAARRRRWPIELAWLPIVVAGLLVIYLPGLDNGLVYDDSYLTSGLFSDYGRLLPLHVRELSYGSFVWLQALFGEGWWKQRLFNLAIHVAVVGALWALYRELLRHVAPIHGDEAPERPYYRSPALAIGIGFFALNPVAVYAVAYLIQRSMLLATLFTVLAFWLFARGLRERKGWMHALALVCYALAILSKEHAVLAPLAAIPIFILVERPRARHLAILAAVGTVLVACAGAALYLRYGDILGKPFDEYSHLYLDQLARLEPSAPGHAWPLSVVNEAWLFFRYGIDWFLPWSGWMSIDLRPPFPLHWYTFPQVLGVLGYAALIVGGFFLLLRYRDGRALLGLSLLLASLLFATEFATVWVQDPFVLYRSYLWAIGVPGVVFFLVHGPSPRVLVAIGAVLGALLAWQAIDRVLSMENAETVWTDAIAKLPDDPRSVGRWFPYLNRGSALVDRDEFELAMRDFQASTALGDEGMGMMNIGSILSARGKQREALAAFDRAEHDGYNLYNLPFQRGLALLRSGDVQGGYDQLQAALARSPDPATRQAALLEMGRAAMQLRKPAEAVSALTQLLAADPRHKEGRYLLGMAYVMTGKPAEAKKLLDGLLQEGSSARAYYARALANYALHRKAEALSDIDNAIRLAGDNASLRDWQAKIAAMP